MIECLNIQASKTHIFEGPKCFQKIAKSSNFQIKFNFIYLFIFLKKMEIQNLFYSPTLCTDNSKNV